MKIGILTYHSVYNFGANLQAYSTVGYLKNNGFAPVVINWIPEDVEARYKRTIPKKQAETHEKFIHNYLPCTDLCRTDEDIINVITKEDIKGVIIGSDAVLRHLPFLSRVFLTKRGIKFIKNPESTFLYPNAFWGSFISALEKKIPVVILSASSQNTNFKYIKWKLRRKMDVSLQKFQYISVRDDWTRKMIRYLSYKKIDPQITPDPVLGYNQNIKKQLSKAEILKKFGLPDKYILISFRRPGLVSKEWLGLFQEISTKYNLSCVALTMPDGIKFDHPFKSAIDIPLMPDEWYGLIRYSSGYIGENMHPIVVALHNAVPFYAFDSYGIVRFKFFVNEKSSKTYDIISRAGLQNNRVGFSSKSYKCPSPEEVFSCLTSFDYSKCSKFASNQLKKYNNMMQSISAIFY